MRSENVVRLRRIAKALAEAEGQGAFALRYLANEILDVIALDSGEGKLTGIEVTLLREGRIIEAIKEYRTRMGAGLKEAKDVVEEEQARLGLAPMKGPQ